MFIQVRMDSDLYGDFRICRAADGTYRHIIGYRTGQIRRKPIRRAADCPVDSTLPCSCVVVESQSVVPPTLDSVPFFRDHVFLALFYGCYTVAAIFQYYRFDWRARTYGLFQRSGTCCQPDVRGLRKYIGGE